MTGEIACTCDAAGTVSPAHDPRCPMVTGYVRPPTYDTGPGQQYLSMPEPILAPIFRDRLAGRETVVVHTEDTGRVVGTVEDVSEDGTVVTVVDGMDQYEIDVTKVVVVQTRRKAG